MSPQGTTVAAKPDADLMVDAYVDALLALPMAGSPPAVAPVTDRDIPPASAAEVPDDATDEMQANAEAEASASPETEVDTAANGMDIDIVDALSTQEQDPAPAADATGTADGTEAAPDTGLHADDAGAAIDGMDVEAQPEAHEDVAAPEPDGGEEWMAGADALDAPDALPDPAAHAPQPLPPPTAAPTRMPPGPIEPERALAAVPAPVGQRWLRVAIGEDRYAVELLRVQEVVRLAPVIAVRGAAPSLLGVMNLRGRVVPVHDLGRWLRRSPVQADDRSRIVVLEHQDELVGLLVTAVTDVVTLDAPQIEPPTPGLRDRIGMGIARTPGAPPTVLLDARVVFD